jgi:hypothetical protein
MSLFQTLKKKIINNKPYFRRTWILALVLLQLRSWKANFKKSEKMCGFCKNDDWICKILKKFPALPRLTASGYLVAHKISKKILIMVRKLPEQIWLPSYTLLHGFLGKLSKLRYFWINNYDWCIFYKLKFHASSTFAMITFGLIYLLCVIWLIDFSFSMHYCIHFYDESY